MVEKIGKSSLGRSIKEQSSKRKTKSVKAVLRGIHIQYLEAVESLLEEVATRGRQEWPKLDPSITPAPASKARRRKVAVLAKKFKQAVESRDSRTPTDLTITDLNYISKVARKYGTDWSYEGGDEIKHAIRIRPSGTMLVGDRLRAARRREMNW